MSTEIRQILINPSPENKIGAEARVTVPPPRSGIYAALK